MQMKQFAAYFALSLAGSGLLCDRANATYSIAPLTVIAPGGPVPDLTFTFLSLSNAPIPTPTAPGQAYNFLTVAVAPNAANVDNQSTNYDVIFQATDNTTLAKATFEVKGTVTLDLDSTGSGSLSNTFSAPFPTGFTLGAIPFTLNPIPPTYSGPTLVNGSGGFGLFTLDLTAVPEPASLVTMSLGAVGLGTLLLRRRQRVIA